jgi:hypothetical protein
MYSILYGIYNIDDYKTFEFFGKTYIDIMLQIIIFFLK